MNTIERTPARCRRGTHKWIEARKAPFRVCYYCGRRERYEPAWGGLDMGTWVVDETDERKTQIAETRFITQREALALNGPIIVLTDNYFSLIATLVRLGQRKEHISGYYDHAMWLIAPGRVVTQNWTLHDAALEDYLDGRRRVKFWRPNLWTDNHRAAVIGRIEQDVAEGRAHRYDYLGIIGQALGCPWLNLTGRWYCSEWVGDVPRGALGGWAVEGMLAHPSPSDLDEWGRALAEAGEWEAMVYDPAA